MGHWSTWVYLKKRAPRPVESIGFGETNFHYLWEYNMVDVPDDEPWLLMRESP